MNYFGDEPIDNRKLDALMNTIYNVWFRKWKRVTHWDENLTRQMLAEANTIWEQGRKYPIVRSLIMAFVSELHARSMGQYPWTRGESDEKNNQEGQTDS